MTHVDQDIRQALEHMGFRYRRWHVYTIGVAPEVLGWLGLNRSTKYRAMGEVEMNPVVGVRHERVETLVAELCREDPHEYLPATVSISLGYLMPDPKYRGWVVGRERDRATQDEMLTALATYGLPFMRGTATLEELCRRLDAWTGIKDQLEYRRPVAWLLCGERARARAMLDDTIKAMVDRTDPAADRFRRFAQELERRLAAT